MAGAAGTSYVARPMPLVPAALLRRWPRLRLPPLSRGDARFLRLLYADARRRLPRAPVRPEPAGWPDDRISAAWLGHSTVLLNFHGLRILTDPVLGRRVGIQIGPTVLGMKRLVAPALKVSELPSIDLVLLSHAHMDHFDTLTLTKLGLRQLRRGPTQTVTPRGTADLLRLTRLRRRATELGWGEKTTLDFGEGRGTLEIEAIEVRHWGARLRTDTHRGYNGYLLRRGGRAVLFAGDTAHAPEAFRRLRGRGGEADGGEFALALMPIGAYDPWIANHCTPEQAVAMADLAGARAVLPIHHQTFKLSREPYDEPIQRFERALGKSPERIALRRIGETFQDVSHG